MTETLPNDIKRWTAKRRTALVLQIIKGETTVRKAAREHGLKASDVQHWFDSFMSGGENNLRSKPREELEHKEHQIKRLNFTANQPGPDPSVSPCGLQLDHLLHGIDQLLTSPDQLQKS